LAPLAVRRLQALIVADARVAGLREETDLVALRGLLALESGETAQAMALFRRAVSVWRSERAVAERSGLDFGAREPVRYWLARLTAAP
jgi:hypothetical protein